jgi:hypothetical protein
LAWSAPRRAIALRVQAVPEARTVRPRDTVTSMRIRSRVVAALVICGSVVCGMSGTSAPAQATALAQTPVRRVALLELFTSEGCSSCPPADDLLRQLNGRAFAGVQIVGLSEHVTYWNHDGWADPFSQEMFTARQAGYADRFRLDSSYTPQLVINGAQQMVGSDSAGAAGDASRGRRTAHRVGARAGRQSDGAVHGQRGVAGAASHALPRAHR